MTLNYFLKNFFVSVFVLSCALGSSVLAQDTYQIEFEEHNHILKRVLVKKAGTKIKEWTFDQTSVNKLFALGTIGTLRLNQNGGIQHLALGALGHTIRLVGEIKATVFRCQVKTLINIGTVEVLEQGSMHLTGDFENNGKFTFLKGHYDIDKIFKNNSGAKAVILGDVHVRYENIDDQGKMQVGTKNANVNLTVNHYTNVINFGKNMEVHGNLVVHFANGVDASIFNTIKFTGTRTITQGIPQTNRQARNIYLTPNGEHLERENMPGTDSACFIFSLLWEFLTDAEKRNPRTSICKILKENADNNNLLRDFTAQSIIDDLEDKRININQFQGCNEFQRLYNLSNDLFDQQAAVAKRITGALGIHSQSYQDLANNPQLSDQQKNELQKIIDDFNKNNIDLPNETKSTQVFKAYIEKYVDQANVMIECVQNAIIQNGTIVKVGNSDFTDGVAYLFQKRFTVSTAENGFNVLTPIHTSPNNSEGFKAHWPSGSIIHRALHYDRAVPVRY